MPKLKYYYSKGSSALAAHILLEEVGAAYEGVEVSIAQGAHQAPAFLAVNPKGRIPALQTPDGVLTENPAILEYIAATHGRALPEGDFDQARARSMAAYLCATVHVAFAHLKRGRRWAHQEASLADMKGMTAQNLADCAAHLEAEIGPWALGGQYSYCDPYLFLMGRWMAAADLTLEGFPKLKAHHAAMRNRPATQRALALHDLS